MTAIVPIGIDLAKNVFAVHGANATGKLALVRLSVHRARLLELIATLPPCLIGVEACSGAHHWAPEFQAFGHTVRLMAPKFVTPYHLSGKRGKNDAADAAAICEAVTRPNMRFVPIKSIEQQGQLLVHRARQGFVEQRTATLNRISSLFAELGIVVPLKVALVRREALARPEDLPGWANSVIGDLLNEVSRLDERINQYDQHIRTMARQSTPACAGRCLAGVKISDYPPEHPSPPTKTRTGRHRFGCFLHRVLPATLMSQGWTCAGRDRLTQGDQGIWQRMPSSVNEWGPPRASFIRVRCK
jgi:transposase